MAKTYIVIYKNKVYPFDNWPDCSLFISDKKNEVKFRGFTNEEEIKKFVDSNIKKNLDGEQEDVLYAYVYGMRYPFNDDYVHGWSFVLVRNIDIVFENAGIGDDSKIAKKYKVTGEIAATMNAIEYAIANKEKRIIIYYKFMGIEMWANGSWTPKKKEQQNYASFIQKAKQQIAIDFIEVDEDDQDYKEAKDLCYKKYREYINNNRNKKNTRKK